MSSDRGPKPPDMEMEFRRILVPARLRWLIGRRICLLADPCLRPICWNRGGPDGIRQCEIETEPVSKNERAQTVTERFLHQTAPSTNLTTTQLAGPVKLTEGILPLGGTLPEMPTEEKKPELTATQNGWWAFYLASFRLGRTKLLRR